MANTDIPYFKLPVETKLEVAISELEKVRNGLHCTAIIADANNDVCGVSITCWSCREHKRLTEVINNLRNG